jgi:hypothetical protein
MEDHLEIEVRDGRAGRAEMIARGDRRVAPVDERPVHRPELLEDAVTLAIETRGGRDGEDRVALEACRALGNQGDRAALPALVRLLASDDARIRGESIYLLSGLTDENFGFAAYLNAEQRADSVGRWKTWLAESGDSAELTFPVRHLRSARGNLNGNTLIASSRRFFIIHIRWF